MRDKGRKGPKKVVTIDEKIKKGPNIYKTCETTEPIQCLKFHYDDEEDFRDKNIDCGNRFWEGDFNDINEYKPSKMDSYIDSYFGNNAFNGESPFAYHTDYKYKSMDTICNPDSYELHPQQKFAGKFISTETNFPGVLIYHGLGSGKSATSVVIGEAMKAKTVDNLDTNHIIRGHCPFRIYIVVPKAVKEQYYEEIIGKIKNGIIESVPGACVITEPNNQYEGVRQFYVGSYNNNTGRYDTDELNYIAQLEQRINDISIDPDRRYNDKDILHNLQKELIERRKEFHNIVNAVYHIVTHDTFINSLMTKDRLKKNRYNPTSFLLTDEMFHSNKSLIVIDEIQRLVSDKGSRFYELFNSFIIYARNRQTGNAAMKIVLLTATPVYDNPHEAALMLNLLRPRIPLPLDRDKFNKLFIKDNTIINPILLKYIYSGYVSYFKGGNPDGYPFRKNYYKLHQMGKIQEKEYILSIGIEAEEDYKRKNKKKKSIDIDLNPGGGEQEGIFPISTQKCNIGYTRRGKSIKTNYDDYKDFRNMILSLRDSNKSVDEILNIVSNYSTKFADIVRTVLKSPGPVFIYTHWVTHGIIPLGAIFEAIGWSFLGESLKTRNNTYAIWSPGGLREKGIVGEGRIEKYIKDMRQIFNSPDNKDGKLCKVLISNVVEGISLKRVNQVHVTEPWWNISKLEQIIARGIRLCSHSDLPENRRYVDVYYHCSIMSSYPDYDENLYKSIGPYKDLARSTIDQKMFITADRKQNINNQFEMILKESAIDCNLNKQGNIIRLEEMIIPSSENLGSILMTREGHKPLYNRSNNQYYLLEKKHDGYYLVLLNIIREAILEPGISKKAKKVVNWPPIAIQRTEEEFKLYDWQVTEIGNNISVIVYENIDCTIDSEKLSKMNFHDAYRYAMDMGEDHKAWKYAHDSYIKMKLLGLLIVKYNMMNGSTPIGLIECLYKLYNNKNHPSWNKISNTDKRKHIEYMKKIFEKA